MLSTNHDSHSLMQPPSQSRIFCEVGSRPLSFCPHIDDDAEEVPRSNFAIFSRRQSSLNHEKQM